MYLYSERGSHSSISSCHAPARYVADTELDIGPTWTIAAAILKSEEEGVLLFPPLDHKTRPYHGNFGANIILCPIEKVHPFLSQVCRLQCAYTKRHR